MSIAVNHASTSKAKSVRQRAGKTKPVDSAAKSSVSSKARTKSVPSSSHEAALMTRLQKSAKLAAAYLQAAFEEGDQAAYLLALRRVAEARGGMASIARAAGVSRESLYRTLSEGGNPRLTTLTAVLQASGLSLSVRAASAH